jgi:hypothetical protein
MRAFHAPIIALAGIASIAMITWRRSPTRAAYSPSQPPPSPRHSLARPLSRNELLSLIAGEARSWGLHPALAAAFADRESQLDPNAEGDPGWPNKNNGDNYRRYVLQNQKFANNPWRTQPELWHSYGLFQLLAPFHLEGNEHPYTLLDPVINTQRGVRVVKHMLDQSNGDLYEARRRYVGCGPGSACESNPTQRQRIDSAWQQTLQKWGLV